MSGIKYVFIELVLKQILVLILCKIHEYTRYMPCRTIQDLFYWPDGICLDTFVVFAAILIGFTVVYDEIKIFQYCTGWGEADE